MLVKAAVPYFGSLLQMLVEKVEEEDISEYNDRVGKDDIKIVGVGKARG